MQNAPDGRGSDMTALTLEQAVAKVTSENPTFELTRETIRGTEYTVFKNVPPHLSALLAASREMHGAGTAEYLVFEGERWTYDAFCTEVARLAHGLRDKHGVTHGTRVAVAMHNCPEMLFSMLAIASLGAVTVFLNAWWTGEELDYALGDSDARIVIADQVRTERLMPLKDGRALTLIGTRDAKSGVDMTWVQLLQDSPESLPDAEIDTDDDFAVMYSSGTTGHPKGVVLTHRGAVNAVFTWLMQAVMAPLLDPPADPAAPAPRPVGMILTPLFHVTATHPVFLLSLPAGAKMVLMRRWDAEEAVRLVRDEGVTRILGVPTQSADLRDAAGRMGEPLPTLDFIGAGGAKRPAAQVSELASAFPHAKIASGWGMTETNANGIGLVGPDYEQRPGAAGRLYPPVQELRILGDTGEELPLGEVGEITVKSPCNMRCYLNKPDATAQVLQEGWLRTGDLGFLDSEGFVTIVDRKKNIIIRGGENIACLDVEGALHRHPAVAEACAFAVPHDRLGEVVGACVQLRAGHEAEADEIKTWLAAHIARFKIPEHLWLQRAPLPRGATDKIDRRGIAARCCENLKENADV